MPLFCPLDRYILVDLASRIGPFFPDPDIEASLVAELLGDRVNNPQDKVGSDIEGPYTSENSISGFEAYLFARPFMTEGMPQGGSEDSSLVAGLSTIFLGGGDLLGVPPPAHHIFFKNCHDGDTCKAVEVQPEDCRMGQAVVSVRVSGIDAPEVGTYYIRNGSGVEVPNPHSPKLVENTDKLRREWLGSAQLSDEELKLANKFIATHIDYTGRLAGLIRNDLNTWNGSGNIPRLIEESQINWVWEGKGEKTPVALCGTWQPFDIYGRRLGSFYQVYPSYLSAYLHERLPELMANEGGQRYEEYLDKVGWLVKKLKKLQNPKVQILVQILGDGLPDPRTLFSIERCEEMLGEYQAFVVAHSEHYFTDDQVLQIIVGSVYGYEKYRNQDGNVYQAANDLARSRGFGFWAEPTFRTLYELNEHDARYHPPHCP